MRKTGIVLGLITTLLIASLAFASWKGTGLRLGITTQGSNTSFLQSTSYSSKAMTNGTYSGVDVSEANVVEADTSSGNVVINDFSNGYDGQVLHVAVVDNTNNATLANTSGSNQEIHLSAGSNETISTSYGGWTLVCNGTAWFEVDQ